MNDATTRNTVLAAQAKTNIRAWKAKSIRNQARELETDHKVADYIIDLVANTAVAELDDETLARVVNGSTADNLRRYGYEGVRSNSGTDITPLFTAALYEVKREFGDHAVRLGVVDSFRGILNTTEIREFYSQEIDRLIRRTRYRKDTGWKVHSKDYGKDIVLHAIYNNEDYIALHDDVVDDINKCYAAEGKPALVGPYTATSSLRGGVNGGIFVLKN